MAIHNWTGSYEISPKTWTEITNDVDRLITAFNTPDVIVSSDIAWDGPAMVNADNILFNMRKWDGSGEEPFRFNFSRYELCTLWNCHTWNYEYDKLVMAVLAVIADMTTVTRITSTATRTAWDPAVSWASRVLQRPIPVPKTIID